MLSAHMATLEDGKQRENRVPAQTTAPADTMACAGEV